jgi:hypothetical protein
LGQVTARFFDRAAGGSGHVPHRQLLGHDHGMGAHEACGQLVGAILAPVGDLALPAR